MFQQVVPIRLSLREDGHVVSVVSWLFVAMSRFLRFYAPLAILDSPPFSVLSSALVGIRVPVDLLTIFFAGRLRFICLFSTDFICVKPSFHQ